MRKTANWGRFIRTRSCQYFLNATDANCPNDSPRNGVLKMPKGVIVLEAQAASTIGWRVTCSPCMLPAVMSETIGERHASTCRYKNEVPQGSRPLALTLVPDSTTRRVSEGILGKNKQPQPLADASGYKVSAIGLTPLRSLDSFPATWQIKRNRQPVLASARKVGYPQQQSPRPTFPDDRFPAVFRPNGSHRFYAHVQESRNDLVQNRD